MTLHQILFALHILAAALGVGLGFGNAYNARLAERQTGDVARGLAMHRLAMLPFTDGAIAVLILSGGALLATGSVPAASLWFNIKMAMVVALLVFYVTLRLTVRQLRKGGPTPALAQRLKVISPLLGLSSVLIVVFAVLAFEV